jgi:uncharacterized protein (TIGR02145 family)
MAEIKNSFLSSKMNQDLDDRLIPNGEYRTALNISIGKSENSDIGTLQNILGNTIVGLENTIIGLECIGYYMDSTGNRIFQFLTNEGDNDTDPIYHQITVYDFTNNTYTVLVEGAFLNFSKSYQITGVTLIENLLYWTDYNNQPRKININSALNAPAYSAAPYYTNEDQISVAKYAPVEAMSLYKKVVTTNTAIVAASTTIPVASTNGLVEGMTLLTDAYASNEFVFIESITGSNVTVSVPITLSINTELTFLISTMSNQSEDPYWPGDPAYLKSRYVRFSYRFRLDDGEYTLMAPFTQIAFIPNQKGYFINGNENEAYTSTVLNWFENSINNIQLLVPFPDLTSNVTQSYKIQSLDILYKESDGQTVKILDTILSAQFAQNTLNNSNIYIYDYQSRKPYKTLPPDQITRVYDIVPVRAKGQETSSNRIIYGNFVSGYTAPQSLNYQVSVGAKQDYSYNFIEYPNHTVKQNRTYQVGFILADKYGRQSSVILSSLDTSATLTANGTYGGSTVYSPYYSEADIPSIKDWYGDAISVLVNSPIVSNYNRPTGEPGLYAESTSTTGFTLTGTTTITNTTYIFTVSGGIIPNEGEYLRGQYTDYVKIKTITGTYPGPFTATTEGRVNSIYARNTDNDPNDIKYVYTINPLGWYSYKIVVRQQEQDYYNVYLPGFLDGYPKGQTYGSQVVYDSTGIPSTQNGINTTVFPTAESGTVAHTVLINDNINKIPRDLVEVGPDQKLYRSSVQLFGRVENTINTGVASNTQYYPSKKADTAIAIATASELSFLPATVENKRGSATYNFYQLESNPLIARISTTNDIGVVAVENSAVSPYPSNPNNMLPYLGVYETKPDYSLLDIFWETSTSGLISDLNTDVLTGYDGANGISEINWSTFTEDLDPNDSADKFITGYFYPISNTGMPVNSTNAAISVVNGYGNPITGVFGLESTYVGGGTPHYEYRIYMQPNQYQVFRNDVNLGKYTFIFSFIQDGQTSTTSYNLNAQLRNIAPTITDTALNPLAGPVNVYLNSPITTGTPVYSLWGKNGSNPGAAQNFTDLRWKINNTGSTSGWQNYFNIITDPSLSLGGIYQINPLNDNQIITLNVELQDAMSSSGVPANGNGYYGSLSDNITINIQLASVLICGRRWTSRNYDGDRYQDGTIIPQAINATQWSNATTGMWCYPNFDEANAYLGKLYNVYAINGIWSASNPGDKKQFAPTGFRVPFYQEQCILSCTNTTHMKSLTPAYPAPGSWVPSVHLGDNSTGFSALPAGYMDETGTWVNTGGNGQIAIYHMLPPTASFLDNSPAYMAIYGNTDTADIQQGVPMRWGLSVRFVDNFSITKTITNTALPGGPNCIVTYNDTNFGNPHVDSIVPGQSEVIVACATCTIGGNCTIT